jgi:anti-sigma regulatory factor (Ser/Thr protein kinase)
MVAGVVTHVETGSLVIELDGRGGPAQWHRLRRAFAHCVTHHPPYVVVHFLRAEAARLLVRLLPALLVRRGGRAAGVSVVVCAPVPVLPPVRLRSAGQRIRFYRRRSEALRALRPHHVPPGARRAHLRLPAAPGSSAEARRMVRQVCARWGVEQAAADAQLVVSELVANAVEHARTEVDVTVSHRRRTLRIAVADRRRTLPDLPRRPGRPAGGPDRPVTVRGRGLALVAQAVTRYGVIAGLDGKVVWACVPVGAAEPVPAARPVGNRWPALGWLRRYRLLARRVRPVERTPAHYRLRSA